MGVSETTIQVNCQSRIKKEGGFVFKLHEDAYYRRGLPDLICCMYATEDGLRKMLDEGWFKDNKIGIFVGIEVKRPEDFNKMDDRRRAQEIVGNEIKMSGGLWQVVCDPDVVEALSKKLKGIL